MREMKSLDAVLGDFSAAGSEEILRVKDGEPVTFWLPKDYKAAYDRIQTITRRQFSKKMRLVIMATIDKVDGAGVA